MGRGRREKKEANWEQAACFILLIAFLASMGLLIFIVDQVVHPHGSQHHLHSQMLFRGDRKKTENNIKKHENLRMKRNEEKRREMIFREEEDQVEVVIEEGEEGVEERVMIKNENEEKSNGRVWKFFMGGLFFYFFLFFLLLFFFFFYIVIIIMAFLFMSSCWVVQVYSFIFIF